MATPIMGKGATVTIGNSAPIKVESWRVDTITADELALFLPSNFDTFTVKASWTLNPMVAKVFAQWRRQARKAQRRYQRQKRKQ